MAINGLQKGSGKMSRVREKSVKSRGILIWIMSGNPGVRCLDCNAEVSAKVLRLRAYREKCPELIKNKTKSKPVKRPYDQIADTTPE